MGQKVRVRPAVIDDAPGIAHVHVATWQAAYRGIVDQRYLDGLQVSDAEVRWREALQRTVQGRFTYVAEAAASEGRRGKIAGFASGGPERDGLVVEGVAFEGEIYALYVAPEYQHQGIGRQLVATSTGWLVEHGAKSIVIWALRDNHPARAFYEALGGVLAGEKTVTIGPSNLVDVAYGWPDARLLLARALGATEGGFDEADTLRESE